MTTNRFAPVIDAFWDDDPYLAEARCAERGDETSTAIKTGNAVDAVGTAFNLLVQESVPPQLDGQAVGHGLPARPIDLFELRALILHPATGYATRDAAWAELVCLARHEGQRWVIGCLGVALPGLKSVLARATRAHGDRDPQRVDEAAAALVSAFYEGLLTIDVTRKAIGPRLLLRARKAAQRVFAGDAVDVLVAPHDISRATQPTVTQKPAGHVDLLLASAVQQGIISQLEASIIGTTRFEDVDAREVAGELGMGYEALMKRRRRTELRLAAAIQSGELGQLADVMSSPGR